MVPEAEKNILSVTWISLLRQTKLIGYIVTVTESAAATGVASIEAAATEEAALVGSSKQWRSGRASAGAAAAGVAAMEPSWEHQSHSSS